MNTDKKTKEDGINLRAIFKYILSNKNKYILPIILVFAFSCIYIFSLPRYYTSSIMLAPETESSGTNSALGSLASSFGFDLGNGQTSDAISPLLYPDLMKDNGFVSTLFNIHFEIPDKHQTVSYFEYLKSYQKYAWWNKAISFVTNLLKKKPAESPKATFDPYHLSRTEDQVAGLVRSKINISINKKTNIISINVEDQNPIICRVIADSVMLRLQDFITEYRTNKARIDMLYYEALTDSAKSEYDKAVKLYGRYADANQNVVLQSYRSKISDLENNIQLKYTTYTTLNTQLQAAKAKVQERTPAFTVIKGAEVPIKPAGPKRMIFVFSMLILTVLATTVYLLRREIAEWF